MTYKETLEIARKNGIGILTFSIAFECESQFTFAYTEEEFEKLCDRVFYAYLDQHCGIIEIWHIAFAINELIEECGKSVEDVLSMETQNLLAKARQYV